MRSLAINCAVGVCFFFKEINISPSIGTHGGGIAQRDVDAAVWQADVVEHDVDLIVADQAADLRLDLREVFLGLLEPRAGGCAHVQAHLAGIHLREEIPSQQREQTGRCHH